MAAIAAVVYGTMYPGQVEWVSLGSPKIGNGAFAEALRNKARALLMHLLCHIRKLLALASSPEPPYLGHPAAPATEVVILQHESISILERVSNEI